MTNSQIKHGVWHFQNGFIPPMDFVTFFDQYKSSEKLRLFITQTELSAYQQKKNIDDWCKKLPSMSEVKLIWLSSKVNQKIFDAVCEMPHLEGIWIKWSSIKSLESITKLKNLKYFYLGSSSQLENINVLENMSNLRSLELEQLNNISDFSAISELTKLEALGIDGSLWTSQKIDSLKPIRNLKRLKYLTVINSKIKDESLDPLLGLTELQRFNCSWNYPEREFLKLKNLPNLKYGNIETSWSELKKQIKSFTS